MKPAAPRKRREKNLLDMTCRTCHAACMISSWGNAATRRFAKDGKGRWAGLDIAKAQLRLNQLDAMQSLDDLGRLRSVGLHKLSGNRSEFWSVTVNGPWRIIFQFRDSKACDVEIIDYH